MKVQHEVLVEKIRPLREVMQGKRDHFYELVMVTAPDRAAIDRVQDEMDSLQADIKRLVIDNMLAQKEILTPEQQSQFFNMIKKQYGNGNYRRN
jgi:Spy/CpxP family protein refolding chaperone